MPNRPKIGAHVSTRGGFGRAARFAWESGAGCFQYFPKNPRSLQLKQMDLRDAESCAAFCKDKGMESIAHTPYPVNLAANSASRKMMVDSLLNDLGIAEACGSLGIVVHFGHFAGIEPLQGYQNIIQCINDTLVNWDGQAKLLIENQAGNHGKEGITLEELVKIRELSRYPDKIGFCLDTCHAFAAGIWNPKSTEDFIVKGTTLGYWKYLVAVHLNDSLYAFGSQRDRHANIGKGCIGEAGLRSLLITEPFQRVAIALETGKGPDGTHRQEMAIVRRWYEEEVQQ
ncbi:deoxyribonuclease IV [Paenibacillus sp. sgz5001063]|uniref:deoxyribonuclease IV n=1 Tax=Paenibacillus sp. sgz5001063 TaxID=3242474 RepID=UPI0036D2C730